MGFVQRNKDSLARIGRGTILILAGVVIGAIGSLIIVVKHQPGPNELKEMKLQYTVKYIKSEQERRGIDCHALRRTFQDFLINDIHPVLQSRKPGQDWYGNVSQDVRKRMGEMQDYYFHCGDLYRAAQNAQWDGFNDLDFSIQLDTEVITLNTLIRFGEAGKKCDATCEGNFSELQNAVNKIELGLAPPSSPKINGVAH